jgi:hypothetical protein
MKKYYINYILENTNYRRNMRNIKLKHRLLIQSSTEITEKLEFTLLKNSMPFYIMAVAFPVDFKKILTKASKLVPDEGDFFNKQISKILKIELVMSKFSTKTLDDFISIPEVSLLLQHYLSKVDNKNYQRCYKLLIKLSEKVLTSFSQPRTPVLDSGMVSEEERVLNSIVLNSLF